MTFDRDKGIRGLRLTKEDGFVHLEIGFEMRTLTMEEWSWLIANPATFRDEEPPDTGPGTPVVMMQERLAA